MPHTHLISPLGETWTRLVLVDVLSRPTAFIFISQNNSIYSPEGGHGGEKQWERGTLENTIRVANAARELGAQFLWIGYDIFSGAYPKSPMDASQYGSWEAAFPD